MIVYDSENYNRDRAIPYCSYIYKQSKFSRKQKQDQSEKHYQNCLNDCFVFRGSECIDEMLDHFLSFKREAEKVKNKVVEYNLYLIAHNGSGFDSYVALKNLPQWRKVVTLTKNGAGSVSLKELNGYVNENKKILNKFISDVGELILRVVQEQLVLVIN